MSQVEPGDYPCEPLDQGALERTRIIDRGRFLQVVKVIKDYWYSGHVGEK
jgi:hypothetical protein